MNKRAETAYLTEAADFAALVADLMNRSMVSAAEAAIAVVTLWLLKRIEAGHATREQADELFTSLDVGLTTKDDSPDLSEEAQELIFEGEHFHHLGEEYGPEPERLRTLALTILGRSACAA
jgi:hypothetical protein